MRYLRLREARAVAALSFLRPPALPTSPSPSWDLPPGDTAAVAEATSDASSINRGSEIMASLREQACWLLRPGSTIIRLKWVGTGGGGRGSTPKQAAHDTDRSSYCDQHAQYGNMIGRKVAQ